MRMRGASWRRFVGVLVAALALGVAESAPVAVQVTPGSRVLVMPFTAEVDPSAPGGEGAALWLGEAAATLLVDSLGTRGVGALSRDQRVTAFDRLNLPMTSALTRATTIRVGELIGASEIVFGQVALGEQLEVTARVIRLSTGQELPPVIHRGSLSDIFAVFDTVGEGIASQTGRFRPARRASQPLALEAFESYFKGLVAATPEARQRFLEAAVRQAPADPRILMALWDVYTEQGDHEHALASANAVGAEAAAFRRARFAVALSMLELRRYDGAAQTLAALHADEETGAISSLLGVVELRRGTPEGRDAAATYFKRAIDEAPEHTDYLFNLGYAHAVAGRPTDGLTWLREVVRFDAADGDAHRVMSILLARAGRTPEAERELDLAERLGGTGTGTAPALSTVLPGGLERVPRPSDLSTVMPLRITIGGPGQRDEEATAAFHLSNARGLIAEGRDRDAIGELRRAIYLSPYEEEPHRLLGSVHQRAGRLTEAIDHFTVALWCRETVDGRVALGGALLESGDVDGARREARRALELDPAADAARALVERAGP